ncbi:MAG: hypothetical protein P8M22_02380 [Phycisphaerales bacterium]|nr:hypothetical protein [Phycisphaerales bacterium]
MFSFKKAGIAVMAGGLVGGFATVALGASELYGVGDMGNFNSPMPDGNADCVIINTLNNTVDISYLDANGLSALDRSGQLVDILVSSNGSGYGKNVNGLASCIKFLQNDSPLAALDDRQYNNGWYVWADVQNNGTGGTGGSGYYQVDGPAGGYFYAGSNARPDTVAGVGNPNARYYDRSDFGMMQVTSGGTGYMVGNNTGPYNGTGWSGGWGDINNTINTNGSLWLSANDQIGAPAGSIGSFGIVTKVNGGTDNPPEESASRDIMEIPTSLINQPGGTLARDAGIGAFNLANIENTNKSMYIFNDNSPAALSEGTYNANYYVNHNVSFEQYGNFRLYLGHTPAPANGNLSALGTASGTTTTWDVATAAGEVANLDIVQNSNSYDPNGGAGRFNGNGTSGIGYEAGLFTITDADGNDVTGVEIRCEVDSSGRVYAQAKGSFYHGLYNANVSSVTGGPDRSVVTRQRNETAGWHIENCGSGYHSTAGWTVTPPGSGFGFDCRGAHLWGQVVNLPYMGCQTNGTDSWNVTGIPDVKIETGRMGTDSDGTAQVPSGANTDDEYMISYGPVPTGHITDGYVLTGGQSYTTPTTGWITPQPNTGTGGVLAGAIGGTGRVTITDGGVDVETDLFNNGFMCYMNGDFNGDGYADLLWHSDDAEVTAIWNMGPQGEIMSAGFLPIEGVGPGWSLAGIGKFGYSGKGCGIFWHNIFDGQTAVWIVDSSHASDADWVVGGVFLDTVPLLSDSPRCSNNVVMNAGNAMYWQDELTGQMAYWPVAINSNVSSGSTSGAGLISLGGSEVLFPVEFATNIAGAGNMSGREVTASNVLRDIVLANGFTGETLVWLMSENGYAIDESAVGGGGGFTTSGGTITLDNFYNFRGIGQYKVNAIYATMPAGFPLPGGQTRETWFADLFWSLPDFGSNFSWKMDRNISLYDYNVTPVTGTGLLVDPYDISGSSPLD